MDKSYFAVGLNDSIEGGRVAGQISLSPEFVTFSYAGGSVRLPAKGIHIEQGGSGGSLIYFSHESEKDWIIYTSDKSVLRDRAISGAPALGELKTQRIRRDMKIAAAVFLLALSVTGIIYLFKFYKETFTFFLASQIPVKWEKSLGQNVYKSLTAGKKMYDSEETLKLLEPITKPLTEAAKHSGYEFKFHIMEDSRVNAFAIPGGNIVIHSELIMKAERPEEIAGVLAHELSHITEKHGLRQIINSVGLFVVIQTLFGDFTGLLAIITQNSGLLISSKFSRDYEREADAQGFKYLLTAKIHPSGMKEFFEKIQKLESEDKTEGEDVLRFLSTHPGTEERIETMKEKLSHLNPKDFADIKMELAKLKAKLK